MVNLDGSMSAPQRRKGMTKKEWEEYKNRMNENRERAERMKMKTEEEHYKKSEEAEFLLNEDLKKLN